jgi:spore germination protein KA
LAISLRLLRFVFLALGASLGFFGIAVGVLALYAHLTALESFGVPFMSPIAPVIDSDLKDTIVRVPWWKMKQRPRSIASYNYTRLGEDSSNKNGGTEP